MTQMIDLQNGLYYLLGFLVTSIIVLVCKMIYDAYTDRRKNKDIHVKLDIIMEDNRAMKKYIRDKGIDDFISDCNFWNKKGYIPANVHAGLLRRYRDLSDLNANGERETGKKILDNLEIKE